METVKCTEERVNSLTEWVKNHGYGLVADTGREEIPLNLSFDQIVQNGISEYVKGDFVIRVVDSMFGSKEENGMDAFYSEEQELTSFAMFLVEHNYDL